MFRKKNIINFIYSIIKNENKEILPFIKFSSDIHPDIPCEICIKYNDTDDFIICFIYLNRKLFMYEKNSDLLKAYLLHEIGHCFATSKLKSDNELEAHLWAIKKSKSLQIPKVTNMLITIIKSWRDINYKEYQFRRYIIAAKKYLKTY